MNKLKMKARSGVTLVELLVVILIVTILSVSLLPLLKPYIEKAKYAAEPIPVLANLQTKIELYQYENNILPPNPAYTNGTINAGYYYSTWTTNSTDGVAIPVDCINGTLGTVAMGSGHLQQFTDTDWQDLSGKNMRPWDFQYVAPLNQKNGSYVYAVGVFGGRGDSGLAGGTGYAVCKIVDLGTSNKVVGVWERYKSKDKEGTPLRFEISDNSTSTPTDGSSVLVGAQLGNSTDDFKALVKQMSDAGWKFSN